MRWFSLQRYIEEQMEEAKSDLVEQLKRTPNGPALLQDFVRFVELRRGQQRPEMHPAYSDVTHQIRKLGGAAYPQLREDKHVRSE
jgi:hypothetical protein